MPQFCPPWQSPSRGTCSMCACLLPSAKALQGRPQSVSSHTKLFRDRNVERAVNISSLAFLTRCEVNRSGTMTELSLPPPPPMGHTHIIIFYTNSCVAVSKWPVQTKHGSHNYHPAAVEGSNTVNSWHTGTLELLVH